MGLLGSCHLMGASAVRRRLFLITAFVCIAACATAALPGKATAAPPAFLTQFGNTGSAAGETTNPRGVATDPTTGHVFVAEITNRRISEFTAWGQFVKAWGWGVADGSASLQTCTATCLPGIAGAGAGQLSNGLGVAVGSTGDVYVVDQANRRVQKFSPSGEFLLMFGGAVNKTTGENVCTKAQLEGGDVCGAGATGTGQGEFGAWRIGSFIAVDSSDTIYVGDNNRIQEFSPAGAFESEIPLPGEGFVKSLAVDSGGNLYVVSEEIPGAVRELDSSGATIATLEGNVEGETVPGAPTALSVDAFGDVYVVNERTAEEPEVLEFDPSHKLIASFGRGELTASTGINVNSIGDVYVSNFTLTNSFIRAYGPLPTKFGPPPTFPPTIAAEYAAAVGVSSAVVKAEINPHFFATTFYVQYGAADCEASACAEQPAAPGVSLGYERDAAVTTAGVLLGGLTPDTTYHYRFVAVSAGGTIFGSDRTFETRSTGAFALPDGRAFEVVSPADKNSAELAVPGSAGSLVDAGFSVVPLQASQAGDAITYASFTSFGDAQSAPAASQYLSTRGAAAWSTENISPPDQEGYTRDPLRGFSPDLAVGAVITSEPTLAPGAVAGFENLYLRDNANGGLRALTTETPKIANPEEKYCVGYAGASPGMGHVILLANGALTADAPEGSGFSLYEWTAGGGLRLVSVLPGGTPAPPSNITGFGAGTALGCSMNHTIVRHAISADGSRIFWTFNGEAGAELLARIDGSETIQIDAPQGGPDPAGEGQFWAASADGSKVFFTDFRNLTADSSTEGLPDLYQYDLDAKSLLDLTVDPTPGSDPANVQGVVGASDDGSYVYFVADGALAEGASPGKDNLYVWHTGEAPRFIATLSAADASDWSQEPKEQTARVTPDGRHLAFLSTAALTPYDNVDQSTGKPDSEVYLYDAGSAGLSCASCNPSGARPIGPATLPGWSTPYEQPRYLSDDGGRLFFESDDALGLQDTNGEQDVYEFEREGVGSCSASSATFSPGPSGCLYSISTGVSADATYFLDASANGRDAFISTRQRLAPEDEDERFDVYDARVGGGFPPQPPPPPPCEGEACRPGQAAPSGILPGSAALFGPGNVKAHRRRHRPRHHAKRKHRRHHGHHPARAAQHREGVR
jgi:hypothetical protein